MHFILGRMHIDIDSRRRQQQRYVAEWMTVTRQKIGVNEFKRLAHCIAFNQAAVNEQQQKQMRTTIVDAADQTVYAAVTKPRGGGGTGAAAVEAAVVAVAIVAV